MVELLKRFPLLGIAAGTVYSGACGQDMEIGGTGWKNKMEQGMEKGGVKEVRKLFLSMPDAGTETEDVGNERPGI